MGELATVAVLENTQNMQRARAGVCPLCSGPMETTLPVTDAADVSHSEIDMPAEAVLVGFACDRCGMAYTVPAGICLVDHPAVVSLYHDHDRDVRGELWTEFSFLSLTAPEVESTDPVRVRVDVEVGDDTLSAWLDDEANVVEYERS